LADAVAPLELSLELDGAKMIRHGDAPYLECSSRGDKRFSAFYARLRSYDNKSIEEIYQAAKVFDDGSTNLTWREAKGRRPINLDEVRSLYSRLWDKYLMENPDLLQVLLEVSGVSDIFGQKGHQCQATELWRIRLEHMNPLTQLMGD